jgi:DNA invertase Pin-like site-specific DNA recombinase
LTVTRVCLYTRISTDEENQPTSLHSQRERLETFCKAQEGWRIVAHHEDRATGTKLDRPGLQAALELARSGAIDLLLVYRVDRLSRKVRQLAQLAEELDTYRVVLRSATEPFDTGSAAGRMMLQMLAVFAEFEHATIVDRVSAGIERRAKEGRWYAGRPPFGYLFSDEQRTLVPDQVKAPVVRRIFNLYTRKRLGTIAIARQLRDEDAPAPAAGRGHPPCTGSSATPPTRAGSAGATVSSTAFTSRLSTSSPSNARSQSCASAARTSPAAAATPPTSCSPASSAAEVAERPTSACPPAATAAATSTTPAAAAKSTGRKPAGTIASRGKSWNMRSSSSSPDFSATATSSPRHLRRPNRKRNGRDPRSSSGSRQSKPRSPAPSRRSSVTTRPSSRASSPRTLRGAALARPGAARRPPRPTSRTLPLDAGRARTWADAGRSRSRCRPTRGRHRRRRAAEGEGAPPPTDPGATRRRTSADPTRLLGSSRPRFAQRPKKWSVPGSNR